MVKGFLLAWGRLRFQGFPRISEKKQDLSTSVKEQLLASAEKGALVCAPAPSLSCYPCHCLISVTFQRLIFSS